MKITLEHDEVVEIIRKYVETKFNRTFGTGEIKLRDDGRLDSDLRHLTAVITVDTSSGYVDTTYFR